MANFNLQNSVREASRLLFTLLAVLVLSLTGCAGDSGEDAEDGTTVDESTATDTDTDEENTPDEPGDEFPITLTHKFGETTIGTEPQNIVSIGYAEHDGLLAFGVHPAAVREWYGEYPFATWPWAQETLGDHKPIVLSGDLNFEQIAELEPDLILGVNAGLTDEEYATLSAIAPTVAQSADYPDYGEPWRGRLKTVAAAVGKTAEAAALINDIDSQFDAIREAHPEFDGRTVAVSFLYSDQPGAYGPNDVRAQVLNEWGFVTPDEYGELAADDFYFNVSEEQMDLLDQDVLLWIVSDASGVEAIANLPLRQSMTALQEGREVLADPIMSGAFSHASPLSLQYVIDNLPSELALAVDGDPETPVPSIELLESDEENPEADPDETAEFSLEQEAAATAWATVFSTESSLDDVTAHLEGADSLTSTIQAYHAAGQQMGGVSMVPTAVTIDGDVAVVTYDVLFGETPTYEDLPGELSLVDGEWIVGQEAFCTFMTSARTPCE